MLEIVTRRMWMAKVPMGMNVRQDKATNVFYSITYTHYCDNIGQCCGVLRMMQNRAMRFKGFDDIHYNFLIGGDARAYECRGWSFEPLLPPRFRQHNRSSVFIAFMMPDLTYPVTEEMKGARDRLVEHGVINDFIASNYTIHRLVNK